MRLSAFNNVPLTRLIRFRLCWPSAKPVCLFRSHFLAFCKPFAFTVIKGIRYPLAGGSHSKLPVSRDVNKS